MNWRLAACLLLSALLHVVLIGLAGFGGPSAGAGDGGRRLVARLVFPPAAAPPAGDTPLPANEIPPSESLTPPLLPPPPAEAAAPIASVSDPLTADTEPADARPLRPDVPLPILSESLPHDFDRDAYFSPGALDRRPTPEHPVMIDVDVPEQPGKQKGRLVLELFVSAGGEVDRIDIGDSDLPPEIGERVAAIFRTAHMVPGMKDGQPVRSRLKIVVEFELR